jgi:beta-lactamase class A
MSGAELQTHLEEIRRSSYMVRLAVAYYDYRDGTEFGFHADELFHAASTIKLAVLLAVFKAADENRLRLDDALHVRNRFISAADGKPFRILRGRDAAPQVHNRIGRTLHIDELARFMITVSSNLATNLLLDYVGLDYARDVLRNANLHGVNLVRGIEDLAAHDRGINNEVTAEGLVGLCRVIQDAEFISVTTREKMLEIMFAQEFNSMIPAGLPKGARVAHKTGEVSTACHDTGLVFLPDRPPYALAVLTEVAPNKGDPSEALAKVSEIVFEHLAG